MMKDERKEEIIQILNEHRFASVHDLCKLLYASEATIRRDLTALEKDGIIHRSHGGAVLLQDSLRQPIAFRAESMKSEKRRIARAAVSLVSDGDILFLDTSTTVMYMIGYLREKKNITVVTNGLPALNQLREYQIPSKCVGGDLHTDSAGFVGYQAIRFVSEIHVDLMFFSTPAIDALGRITDYSEEETYIRREMLRNAKKSVFLFDSTKFEKTASFHVAHLSDIHYVISDMELPGPFSDAPCEFIQV